MYYQLLFKPRSKNRVGMFQCIVCPIIALVCTSIFLIPKANSHDLVSSDIERYREKLINTPDDFSLRKKYIEALRTAQHYDDALSELSVLRSQIPDDPQLNYEASFIYFEQGKYEQSSGYADKFINAQPQHRHGLSISARAKLKTGHYKEAIEVLDLAIEQYPSPDFFLYQANAYYSLGEINDAINTLEKGVSQLGKLPLLMTKITQYYTEQKRYKEAIESLQRLISSLSPDARVEHYLTQKADILSAWGYPAKARALYQRSFELINSRNKTIRSTKRSKQLLAKLSHRLASTSKHNAGGSKK